jgi:5-hydroxyisourate hydrolase
MSGITTHVLDTSVGRPATGVPVKLSRLGDNGWLELASTQTDSDGRAQLTAPGMPLRVGDHCIRFGVGDYFGARDRESFYPKVTIRFSVTDPEQHYHVPLLLSPYGYSTYRGS